jgi:hypothetical protein
VPADALAVRGDDHDQERDGRRREQPPHRVHDACGQRGLQHHRDGERGEHRCHGFAVVDAPPCRDDLARDPFDGVSDRGDGIDQSDPPARPLRHGVTSRLGVCA